MDAVKPAEMDPDDELSQADHVRATLNILEDFIDERQQLKDTQLAFLNILEDSANDRQEADAALKASLNILEDLSDAQAEIRTLNAELEARVEQRTAELVAANKNLAAFNYSVAHDLRTPLRALGGYSAALLEDYGDRLDETGRGFLERIQAASERIGVLIDDLLTLSRVSRAEMSLEPVDLSAEVAAVADDLQSCEPSRRVRFVIQHGVTVTADRALIGIVLRELIGNAWKFTANRDGASIEFGTTTAEGAGVCCYVRDNGTGFDPAYAASCSSPSSGSIRPPSSPAPGSAWPGSSGSSNATAGAPGPKAPWAAAPPSTSP